MPPQLTKEDRISIFEDCVDAEGNQLTIDQRVERSWLSRTALGLCKEAGCENDRQQASSRCKAHSRQ